jgi:DNA-binding transcriptional MocR family regulator
MFPLDRDGATSLAEQIEQRLRDWLREGRLAGGARLPSIRQLASQLGVSPNTVVVAYDRLVAAGLVEARGTAGYFVAAVPDPGSVDTAALLEAGEAQDAVWLAQQSWDQPSGLLLASAGALPAAWLQDAIPATVLQRAYAALPGGMGARCPPQGLPALRERLALMLRGQGMAVDASRVMTTAGGTQAIDLICRAYLRAGDAVVVENPGYHLLHTRLAQGGAVAVPVARRSDGIDLAELEQAFVQRKPHLLFLQSVLHNPTGWTSSAANLHRVLRLAERHGVLVAEDDVHGHFLPGTPTRLAQLAGMEGVIYYSSFCKVLSPALRMGYLAAEPALLKPLLREKICVALSGPTLNEAVLLEMLATGRVRKHAQRLQARLAAARVACLRDLQAAGIAFEAPADGGLFLWGGLPAGVDLDLLVRDAWHQGILLSGGATFSAGPQPTPHLRFNVVHSRHVRLQRYLTERLAALAQGQRSVARLAWVR